MRPIENARPRASKAIQGLLMGLPISMGLWLAIGVATVTAIS